ncbi:MAG: hypothetical protein ACOCP9_03365 [Halofilum sp. (in: g-proteobacteria)]
MSPRSPTAADSVKGGGGARSGAAETALLRAVLHILFGAWGLGVREVAAILGGVSLRTLFRWREQPEAAAIDATLRYRLSGLLALHKALRRACPDTPGQRAWLRTAHADGRTPVVILMEGRCRDLRSLRERIPNRRDSHRTGQ